MNVTELRNIIQNFNFEKCNPGSQGFSRILLQLFGFLGHGKSSFINTCMYVWEDGAYKNWAKADSEDGGHTTERITYPLTQNITLVDNRGFSIMGGYETGEIFAQLECGVLEVPNNSFGAQITTSSRAETRLPCRVFLCSVGNLLPLDTPVEWNEGFGVAERIVEASNSVKTSDFIVPIFIYSVKKGITQEEIDDLTELIVTARDLTGMFPIVVLTHETHKNKEDVVAKFRDLGVEQIFSLENYTAEDHEKTTRHEKVLKFLYEVIKDVQFKVGLQRDPEEEMLERKMFVLRYVHHNDLKIHYQKAEKQKFSEQRMLENELSLQSEMYERQSQEEERKYLEEVKKLQHEQQEFNNQPVYQVVEIEQKPKKRKKKWYRIFIKKSHK
ncbi:uncharacterized protein LOC142098355 [Mixophyes fleayi]|uniref:uncharacterized protein LOC142098355 n=1 Tax=Mixophyes fleayi TaxID=3061075 RepID=UPI003F4DBB50